METGGRGDGGELLTQVQTQQVTYVLSGTSRKEYFQYLPPEQLVEDIAAEEERILAIMAEIRQVLTGGK